MLTKSQLRLTNNCSARTAGNTSAAHTSASLRVLVMAANDSDALFLTHMAQISSYGELTIETVNRLAQGTKQLCDGQFDLVLLDLDLADSCGLESFTRLSNLAPRTPVVVVVGVGNEEAGAEAVRCGAQDFLVKQQITPHTLTHSLRCALERHRQLIELRELSMTDPLTGLYNRRGFWALADSHIRMTRRQRRRSLLFCADLDGLKNINDRLGHDEGDRAIVRTAELLRSCFRDSDIVARFGGDEFVALAYDTVAGAETTLINRIKARLQTVSEQEKRGYTLSLCIGTAVVTGSEDTNLVKLMRKADRALYSEKKKRSSQLDGMQDTPDSHSRRMRRATGDLLTLLQSSV